MSGRDRSAVIAYVYALLAVVVLAAATLVGLTVLRYEQQSRANQDLENFHLRTLTITNEISSRLDTADASLPTGDVTDGVDRAGRERRLAGAVLSVAQAVDEISELQDRHGEAVFEGTVERLGSQAGRLRQAVQDRAWSAERWDREFAAVELSTFQLHRLHSITVEEELQKVDERRGDLGRASAILTPIVVIGFVAVVSWLIGLVRRRLRDLDDANAELLRTRERLEQSQRLEALGTLIGGVAHDFNNLLTAILGHTEVELARTDPDGPSHESLRTIQRAGQQAAGLTHQLLAFSRAEVADPVPTDLNGLLRNVAPVLRGLMPSGTELEISTDPSAVTALVDPVHIEQVVLNLVVNARDAMPDGGRVSVELSNAAVTRDGRRGRYARIRVEDDGAGMAADVQARMYEPFFSTKEKGRGTGLGLSMVHGIVTASAGFLEVESDLGAGSRFDVYLPTVETPAPTVPPHGPVGPARASGTILVVEDEDEIRDLLEQALDDFGYRVITAGGGDQALGTDAADLNTVDLVLTDVEMAGMRGPELIAALRSRRPELAVVYMSGYSEESLLDSMQPGDAFLHKPFKLAELRATVRRALERSGSEPAPPVGTG